MIPSGSFPPRRDSFITMLNYLWHTSDQGIRLKGVGHQGMEEVKVA